MRPFIPFPDELVYLGCEVSPVFEIGDTESLALEYAEPLLDLVHPRAVDRRELELKTRALLQPLPNLFAVMHGHIVQNQVNGGDRRRDFRFQVFEEGNEFLLPFALVSLTVDLAGAGVEGGEELESALAFVFMFNPVGDVARLCRSCRGKPRPGLERSLFVG